MICNVKDITDTMKKITAIASADKTVPGVLIEVGDTEMGLSYSNGRKAIIEKFGYIKEEGDRVGRFAVSYELLSGVISNCQSSGNIIVNELSLKVEDTTIKIVAEQKACMNDVEVGSEEEADLQTFARKEFILPWKAIDADMKTALLGRMNYDNIFSGAGSESPTVWNIGELKEIINKVTSEKGRTAYIKTKDSYAFVANTAYVTVVPFSNTNMHAIVLESGAMKMISDIISTLHDGLQEVNVYTVEGKFLNLFSADGSMGLWFEMSQPNQLQMTNLARYEQSQYNTYQLMFRREFLADAIKSALNTGKAEKTTLEFADSTSREEGIELQIKSGTVGSSSCDKYTVQVESVIDRTNSIKQAKITIAIKIMNDMISMLKSDFIALDIKSENGTTIRLAEIDASQYYDMNVSKNAELGVNGFALLDEPTELEIRKDCLGVTQYVAAS